MRWINFSPFFIILSLCLFSENSTAHEHSTGIENGIPLTIKTSIGQHSDADHCSHLPISWNDHCVLCSSTHQNLYKYITISPEIVRTLVPVILEQQHCANILSTLSHSLTHRGPPFLLN